MPTITIYIQSRNINNNHEIYKFKKKFFELKTRMNSCNANLEEIRKEKQSLHNYIYSNKLKIFTHLKESLYSMIMAKVI